jgi:hypothetical protein
VSRNILSEATAESGDGYSITVKALSEDKAQGAPRLANRGAADIIVTGPDGTTLSFRLPGEQAALIVRPLAVGAVAHESEGDVARRYLKHMGPFYPEQQAELERRAELP